MKLAFIAALLLAPLAALQATDTATKLSLPAIFGDHMVLQRGREIPVWGLARPGEKVIVTLSGNKSETAADAEGKWKLSLPAMPASKVPLQMTVTSGPDAITCNDVLLGDAWLCSGQSNMGMGVGALRRSREVIASATNAELRLFVVQRHVAYEPDSAVEGKWVVCSPQSIMAAGGNGFSAVGYFFGQAIQHSQNIPVGLIGSYVGGSNIASWVGRETLRASPKGALFWEKNRRLEQHLRELPEKLRLYKEESKPAWDKALADRKSKYAGEMEAFKKASVEARSAGLPAPARPVMQPMEKPPTDPLGDFSHGSSLYHGMIFPLAPFALKGVIWYQGEANAYSGMDVEYQANLIAMIGDWRRLWNQADLPFLVVQLPNLISNKDTWPVLRESQRLAVLKTAGCGLVATYDVGDPNDLHPAEKQAIGERLGLLARAMVYGDDVIASGPAIQGARLDGNGVELTFEHAGGGLMVGAITVPAFRGIQSPDQLKGFEVAAENRNFLPAKAEIKGEKVVLSHATGMGPIRFVRYAWAQNPNGNLYNKAGLPAVPFEIETSTKPGTKN